MRPDPPRDSPRDTSLGAPLAIILAAASLAGCAGGRSLGGGEMGAALAQPFRDLNMVQEEPAQVVRRAAEAPYAPPADCAAARAELVRLERALGADAGTAPDAAASAEGLAAGLLRGVAAIPFRGLVRRVTGAEKSDREARQAVLAAVGRRGFLRGWQLARCPGQPAGTAGMPSNASADPGLPTATGPAR